MVQVLVSDASPGEETASCLTGHPDLTLIATLAGV